MANPRGSTAVFNPAPPPKARAGEDSAACIACGKMVPESQLMPTVFTLSGAEGTEGFAICRTCWDAATEVCS
jgi:hypothetical protein